MTGRDRTQEFLSAVQSIQSRQANGFARPHRKQAIEPDAFGKIAKQIGVDLSQTVAKLQKLTLLAKDSSIFDDHAVEIQELTQIIKEDINVLNHQIAQLQELARSNRRSQHVQSHKKTVAISLQSRLAGMSKDFKSVLEVRTENMKQQQKKRDQYSQDLTPRTLPFALSGRDGGGGSALLRTTSAAARRDGSGGAGHVELNMEGFQDQLMASPDQSTSYAEQRADAVASIESTIVELGSIFSQLANMVQEQEEQVMRIDQNVDETVMNVEAGYGELLKYFKGISSNRWLMVKIFMVVLVFFIVFVVFMT